jgi:tape measure domain-containing protein
MSSRLESAGIAFETMLGSAEKAQAFLSDMQDFAAKTPFEFPELVDASKRMLAFGFSAESIRPTLTAVGNAAAAMGSGAEGINRITTALGQMQAKGKLQAEEMLQLTEAGIPAWDMLAKKLGTDVAGAMDAVTKRTVDAQTFMEAFMEGTAARFGDMMSAQSHTFAGAMSTVRDTIGQLVGGAFQPFFVQISSFADQLAQGLGTDAFQTWASNVQEVLGRLAPLFGQFMDQFKALGPVIQQFINDHIQGFVAGVQSMGERILAILPAVGDMFGELGSRIERGLGIAGPIIGNVTDALGQLAGPAGDAYHTITQLSDAFQGQLAAGLERVREPAQAVLDWLTQLGGALGDVPGRVLGDLGTVLSQAGDALDRFGSLFSNLMTTLGASGGAQDSIGGISDVVHGLLDAMEAFGATVQPIWLAFQENAINAYNAVQPVLENLRAWLSENLPPAIAALQQKWQELSDELGPTFRMAWQVLEPILASIKDWLGNVIPQAVDFVKSAIGGLFQFIGEMAGHLADLLGPLKDQFGGALHDFNVKVQEALAAARPAAVEETKQTAEAVRQEFIQGTLPVVPAMQDTGEKAGEALASGVKAGTSSAVAAIRATAPAAQDAGEEVGAALVQGVEAGMDEHQGAAVDRFANVVVNIVNSGRSAIQAHSPSELTAEQIGEPMVEGIADGFTRGLSGAIDTVTSGIDRMVKSASNSMGDFLRAAQLEGNYNAPFTYGQRDPEFMATYNMLNTQKVNEAARANLEEHLKDQYAQAGLPYPGFEKAQAEYAASMNRLTGTPQFLTGGGTAGGGRGGGGGGGGGANANQYGAQSISALAGTGLAQHLVFANMHTGEFQSTPLTEGDIGAALKQQFEQALATSVANAKALVSGTIQGAWSILGGTLAGGIAHIPQAFSAYALTPTPGLGNPAANTGGSGIFTPNGNTPGGANFGALQALAAQITAAHPDLSADAQARLIQQGMRTNQDYIRVVGQTTDTTDDLRRQQEDATEEVQNWTNVVNQQGAAYAQGTGAMQSLIDAQANLAAVTNQLASTVTAPTVTAPPPTPWVGTPGGPPPPEPPPGAPAGHWVVGPYGQGWQWLPDSPATTGTPTTTVTGLPAFATGGLVMRPTLALVGEAGPEAVIPLGRGGAGSTTVGDIYITVNSSAASTAQEAAELARRVREELRRQGVDVSRLGGL